MIAKNEADRIETAIDSVKSLVSEIILVDTGSTDNTMNLAAKKGAQIFQIPWTNDFSSARNEAIKHATGDWILYIDADEVISPQDFEKIKQLTNHQTMMGWILDQRNYTDNTTYYSWQPCDTYPECRAKGFFISPITRLFRNDKRIRFINKVHEEIDTAITSIGGSIGLGHIPIHHYGYLKGEDILSKKRDLYLELGIKDMQERPNNPKGYYEVGKIYKTLGRFPQALQMLTHAASLDPFYKLVYTNLGDVLVKLGQDADAIKAYDRAIQLKPYNENAFINKGLIFIKRQDYATAIECFEAALRINPHNAAAHTNIVASLTRTKNIQRLFFAARRAYRSTELANFKAVLASLHKRYPAQIHLAELIADHKYGAAELYLQDMIYKKSDDIWALSNLAVVFEKQGKNDRAREIIAEALLYDSPQQEELQAYFQKL